MTRCSAIFRLLATSIALGFGSNGADAAEKVLPPPYAGVYQPHGVDEIGLWHEDDESERELAASPAVIRDETLTSYVRSVLCETVGDDRCRSVRVYIVREPSFNATMSPNGTMRVFSGLFLRVRSEAELGAVLGHEFGHFESRHTLSAFRARRGSSDLLAWSALLTSMAPSYGGMRDYRSLEISVYGSLFRHGRDQERAADRLGIAYLNNSHLRPQAAAQVWVTVMGEAEASAQARGLKRPNFKYIAFTASHPPSGERAAYLADMAEPDAARRDDGGDRYRTALAAWMPVFLSDQIKLNDFGGSDYLIGRLAGDRPSASLWFARGELYRTRGTQRDFVNAAQFYQNAVQIDPTLADAYRGLGLALFKTARSTEGAIALQRYLSMKPNATDADVIRTMIPAGTDK